MDKVDQLIRRTRRSWYIDGFPDLSLSILLWYVGGLNLAMSFGLLAITEFFPPSQLGFGLLLLLLSTSAILLLAAMVRLLARVVWELKARLTCPRIGYALPFRHPLVWQHWLLRLLSFELCIALLILTKFWSPTSLQWFPALFGLFIASMHLEIGYSRSLHRFYLLAAFSFLLVAIMLLVEMETVLEFEFYSSLMGIAEMFSGSTTLWIFLHRYPLLSQESI